MDKSEKKRFSIRSGSDAINSDVPEIDYIIEQKLRRKAKYSVVAKWKAGKSFLTIQAGMAIAAGADFLGFKTTRSNVLYINFEISEEMFQQRVQDMQRKLGYDLSRFKYLTITDLSLDMHTNELDEILTQCISESFPVEVLVIDPRWKAVKRDSNQDEVINAFCVNLDKIIAKYGVTLIIVHHEGVSGSENKAGKGSTVFEAWLDGWLRIKPVQGTFNLKQIDIWSRDSEREYIAVQFNYPIHEVAPEFVDQRKGKTDDAKKCIVDYLENGDQLEVEVRFHVLGKNHTEYAFNRARKELENEGIINLFKASGPGNRKMISLIRQDVRGE
ncbi:MAG: AAA family ATPase [Dehalococcoidales bacterium]|nr:AAA family ATPase [Dehalococcoidales bacterium]